MKGKKFCSAAVSVLLALLMSAFMSVPAFAEVSQVSVKVKKGDTVYGICQSMGLNYNTVKNTIMTLNGMTRESELSSITAGSTLIMPSSDTAAKKGSIVGEDKVRYYVIPYVMEKGNWIANIYYCWGLNYENYLDDIKSLNGIEDLDTIYVGKTLLLPTTAENLMSETYTTVMEHTMKTGETAYEVCKGYGLDYYEVEDKLVKYNFGADMTKLQAGQTMLIPID